MKVFIERLGINGEGIAKGTTGEYLDKICFVPLALPGEMVDIDIVGNKKNFCNACAKEIIQVSQNRISPPCKYFGKCGGCDIQHMDKVLQEKFKREKVKDTISKITGNKIDVSQVVRLNDFEYRNKMVFPIVDVGEKPKLGMFSVGSHSIVSIDNCALCKDIINKVYSVSKEYFENSDFTGYDFESKRGDIKYLVVRAYDQRVLVTIVATRRVNLNKYYQVLQDCFEQVGLSLVISNSQKDIMAGEYIYLQGLKVLEIEEFGIKYKIDNRGFMQVNDQVKTELYGQVLSEIKNTDNVIDCYSGAGLLSAIVAKICKSVIGIEINESASNSAKTLAKENSLNNIEFVTGDVKTSLSKVLNTNDANLVILDPPRSGCDRAVLDLLIKSNIEKIIYISCDPATLSRDLGILQTNYTIKKVIPWDMFPQTKHVETLVVLKRK